ncbi:FAD-dependent monooxygenase [Paracoccus siganidrum]|uniref:FAD-binding protein n=1 Tax=Paracoccus siganidrum TaxID=1276757 RepID=A0A419A9W5_9RHOB|nr:FAD-dependent monooxygenase [Paracoccus siganidrum]RJL19290.1 FAD-binding protein [Paracoccus siganidrum]RMC33054.1 monooxygenase [Paracoccus siganidrum]
MSAFPERTEVAIVGAGPAGLALAIGLARRGVDFVILDALPEAQNTSRAAVIHAGTLKALEPLDLAGPLIAQGLRVTGFRVRDRDRVLLRADFRALRHAPPFALMIPQDETEAILTRRLAGLGHAVLRPLAAERIETVSEGAVVTLADGRRIAARYVVGADGQDSTVRRQAGIDFPGKTHGSFMLADLRMDWPIPKDEVTLFFSAGGTLVVAPMSQDRYRVVAQCPEAPPRPSVADVQAVIDARGPRHGARVRQVLWGSRFRVHHRLAERFRAGPVLLIGDAAHVHSPAGGQGMNLGLRDAAALAEALTAALREGREGALDDHAAARMAAAREVLRMTDRLTAVATLRAPPLRLLRNLAIRAASSVPALRRRVARLLAGAE